MEPRRSPLAPDLHRWASQAPTDDARTVVVRLTQVTDSSSAAEHLAADGAVVTSVGRASVTCRVTPQALRRLVSQPWIAAVEVPRRLFPSFR